MTIDAFTDRLSDYVDRELSAADAVAVESHLAECAECRGTLDDLRAVVARAASLADSAPGRDLWAGVAARIAAPAPRAGGVTLVARALWASRFSFTLPQLAAASLALMVLSGGLVWMARSGDPRADFEPISAHNEAPIAPANTPAKIPDYDGNGASLTQSLDGGRSGLDAETVRVLESNLATIARAIDECRRARSAEPANVYLNRQLADAEEQRLSLLRLAKELAAR